MFARPHRLFRAVVLVATLFCAQRAGAQIATVSPFLPAASAAASAPTAGAPLEFRGVMEDSDGLKFRIVDTARKAGTWVKLNERDKDLDLVVKQHSGEGDQETVVVEQGGQTYTLPVHTAKVVSTGAGGQMMMPPPGMPANLPPAIINTVNVNPTQAQEQARLQAVADEVARRRALREQAAQQVNQGQAAALAQQVIQQQQAQMQAQQQQQLLQRQQGQPGNGLRGQRGQGGPRQRN